ncbi:MAG: outer membrane beta-barrel protein [Pyrinomonadaceae bacterium]|nr:outer membrane beta-barrel protein [Pyrinomonadaceae bacterium]
MTRTIKFTAIAILISISLVAINAQEQTLIAINEETTGKIEKKEESSKKRSLSNDELWTGFYIGGYVGTTNNAANVNTSTVSGGANNVAGADLITNTSSQIINSNSFTGGATFGYNFQKGKFLAGAELDFGEHNFNKSVVATATFANGRPFTITQSVKNNWLLSVRPRVGMASKKVFFYATGGLAITNVKYNGDYLLIYPSEPGFKDTTSGSFTKTKAGWTAGAGVEFKVSKHWSVKGEYLFNQFSRDSVTTNNYTTFFPSGSSLTPNQPYTYSTDFKSHSIRFGINYRF